LPFELGVHIGQRLGQLALAVDRFLTLPVPRSMALRVALSWFSYLRCSPVRALIEVPP
jgi:hypothetical protein